MLMLTYPAGGLKVGLVFIYIHTFVCASSESSGEILKNAHAYWICGTCDMYCTYLRVDKLYKVKHSSSLFGPVDDTWHLHL